METKQITKSLSIDAPENNECIFINIQGTIAALSLEEATLFQEIFKIAVREKINYNYGV